MKIIVNKTCATVSGAEMLTSGMVGKTIDVEFSADWLGLIKIAVFTNGETTRDVLDPNGSVIIPWEVLATPNKRASVGFYGYKMKNGEKVLAIPTIWAELGAVRAGADPSGDPSAELSPTVAEQLQADVNDLDDRVTYIEEHGGGGGGTTDHTQLTNRDVANQHPVSAITGLQTALDSKGTYSKPTGGIPKTDLASDVQTSLGRADTALQSHQSLAGYATESYVQNYHDNTKQDVISDLATIRNGAALGATALQEHQSLSAYRTASAQDAIDSGFVKLVGAAGQTIQTNVAVPLNVKNNIVLQHRAFIGFQTHDDNAIGFIGVDGGKPTFLAADGVTAKALQGETIADTAGYYTTDTVEGALAEIGAELAGINTLIGSGVIT